MSTTGGPGSGAVKRLPFRTKLAYGVGDLGGNLYFTIMGTFLFSFCTEVLGIDPVHVGIALAVGRVVDAVTDPAVGILSDRVDTPIGHRKPFMLGGATLILPLMLAMFSSPGFGSPIWLAVWVGLIYSLMNTAYTLHNVPYSALVPELTSDFHERTNIARSVGKTSRTTIFGIRLAYAIFERDLVIRFPQFLTRANLDG